MLKFENISYEYGNSRKALDNISLSIEKGQQVAIVGANGAGKTTLMKAALGLVWTSGNITVDGLKVNKDNLKEVRKIIGYIAQDSDSQLFMPTVLEDMIFGPVNYGMSKEDAVKRADEVLEEVGNGALRDRRNMTLSSGEKRMAAIATILAMEPDILFLDEPSSTLDYHHRRLLINALDKLPVTKLIATHDLDLVLECCDRVILINNGTIVADGDTLDILSNKKLLEDNGLELPFCIAGLPERCKDKL